MSKLSQFWCRLWCPHTWVKSHELIEFKKVSQGETTIKQSELRTSIFKCTKCGSTRHLN